MKRYFNGSIMTYAGEKGVIRNRLAKTDVIFLYEAWKSILQKEPNYTKETKS